eukprot:15440391-Alexandrium_andersonii.AAC.1
MARPLRRAQPLRPRQRPLARAWAPWALHPWLLGRSCGHRPPQRPLVCAQLGLVALPGAAPAPFLRLATPPRKSLRNPFLAPVVP